MAPCLSLGGWPSGLLDYCEPEEGIRKPPTTFILTPSIAVMDSGQMSRGPCQKRKAPAAYFHNELHLRSAARLSGVVACNCLWSYQHLQACTAHVWPTDDGAGTLALGFMYSEHLHTQKVKLRSKSDLAMAPHRERRILLLMQ